MNLQGLVESRTGQIVTVLGVIAVSPLNIAIFDDIIEFGAEASASA